MILNTVTHSAWLQYRLRTAHDGPRHGVVAGGPDNGTVIHNGLPNTTIPGTTTTAMVRPALL